MAIKRMDLAASYSWFVFDGPARKIEALRNGNPRTLDFPKGVKFGVRASMNTRVGKLVFFTDTSKEYEVDAIVIEDLIRLSEKA